MGEKIIPVLFDYTCCKNCTERHSGCHAECEEYLAIKEKNEQIKETIRTKRDSEYHSKHAARKHEKIIKERNRRRYYEDY